MGHIFKSMVQHQIVMNQDNKVMDLLKPTWTNLKTTPTTQQPMPTTLNHLSINSRQQFTFINPTSSNQFHNSQHTAHKSIKQLVFFLFGQYFISLTILRCKTRKF
jgi:hypothetical protein